LCYIALVNRKEVINMPYRDGTGPEGKGARTGRGFGPCRDGMRRGDGRGFGRGLGLRNAANSKKSFDQDKEKND
jgi:hypothetical protein